MGALVIAAVDDPWALVLVVALLIGLAGAPLGYHYGLGVIALTAGILALLDLGHPGSLEIVDERVANTLLGGDRRGPGAAALAPPRRP